MPDLAKAEKRVMDCVDCHNRPTHIYRMPEEAMDQAILNQEIDVTLPYIKRKGVELLKASYASESAAQQQIVRGIREYYQKEYPQVYSSQQATVDAAALAVFRAYSHNVFPQMNLSWGTYPNNLGHQVFPGCWRCHDENHKSKDGKTITQDCTACHDMIAQDEENPKLPSELLKRLP